MIQRLRLIGRLRHVDVAARVHGDAGGTSETARRLSRVWLCRLPPEQGLDTEQISDDTS